jgi:hypothetical protein
MPPTRPHTRPAWPAFGDEPLARGFRNGVVPPGGRARSLASYVNQLLAWRQQCAFRESLTPSRALNTATTTTTWRGRFYAGPNVQGAQVRMVFAPTEDPASPTPTGSDPRCIWTVTPSGGAGVAQEPIRVGVRVANTTTIVPDHYLTDEQTWALTPGTHYEIALAVYDYCRPISAAVWLEPRSSLSYGADACVSDYAFYENGRVLDAGIADLFTEAVKVWKAQGTHHGGWTKQGNTAFTRTANTDVSIVDSSFTAWNSGAPGIYTIPYLHGSMDSNNVPAVFAVYAGMSAGTGTVKLLRNGGTLGTISVTGAAAWRTASVNLRADQTSDKYDVVAASDGVNTLTVEAYSLYEYSA